MRGQGHQLFIDELTRFAAEAADQRVQAIVAGAGAPLRVVIRGRRGVGCGTVARALGRAGIALGLKVAPAPGIADVPGGADVQIYLIAEVVKPEDRQAVQASQAAAQRPTLVVLNKADLTGFSTREGPIAAARSRCAHFSALLDTPVEPMVGLLALTALGGSDDHPDKDDEELWTALRTLADHAGGAAAFRAISEGSYDGFVAACLPVATGVRLRLLDALDLFGIALGIAAFRAAACRTPAQLHALLRRVSGVDVVVDKIAAVAAEVRYRRVLDAVAALEAMAVTDQRISEFLSRHDTVVARMAAAVDFAEAAGMQVGSDDSPAAYLSRAARWQRYCHANSLRPAGDVQRACGMDIARGSLRLWSRPAGVAR